MDPAKGNTNRQVVPWGLWELDTAGTVLYYEPENDRGSFQRSEVIGRNFFDEVMSTAQAQEMRDRIERFRSGWAPVFSFDLDLHVEGENIRTRNLLRRISGKEKSKIKVNRINTPSYPVSGKYAMRSVKEGRRVCRALWTRHFLAPQTTNDHGC